MAVVPKLGYRRPQSPVQDTDAGVGPTMDGGWDEALAGALGRSGRCEQYCGDEDRSACQVALERRVRKRLGVGGKGGWR